MREFGKVLGLTVWSLVTVAASAASMNTLEGFYIFCGLANLLINGYCIVKTGKKISNDAC